MSFWRIFAICPRITCDGDRLVARTALRVRLLLFGAWYREVTVDAQAEQVTVYRRLLWGLQSSRTVSFREIAAVTYGYSDESAGSLFDADRGHNSLDLFSVGLQLNSGEEVHLFYFYGDGVWTYYGDDPWGPLPPLFEIEGSQEGESRTYADTLSKIFDVTVVPPRR